MHLSRFWAHGRVHSSRPQPALFVGSLHKRNARISLSLCLTHRGVQDSEASFDRRICRRLFSMIILSHYRDLAIRSHRPFMAFTICSFVRWICWSISSDHWNFLARGPISHGFSQRQARQLTKYNAGYAPVTSTRGSHARVVGRSKIIAIPKINNQFTNCT